MFQGEALLHCLTRDEPQHVVSCHALTTSGHRGIWTGSGALQEFLLPMLPARSCAHIIRVRMLSCACFYLFVQGSAAFAQNPKPYTLQPYKP